MATPKYTETDRDHFKQIGRERYEDEFSSKGLAYGDYPDPYGDGTTYYTYALDGVYLRRCPAASDRTTSTIFDANTRTPVDPPQADASYLIDPHAPQSDWMNHPNATKANYR